jgi:hypothetical protein
MSLIIERNWSLVLFHDESEIWKDIDMHLKKFIINRLKELLSRIDRNPCPRRILPSLFCVERESQWLGSVVLEISDV